MIIEPARPDDLPLLLRFRAEASAWLAEGGIDQWSDPWPTAAAMAESMLRSIRARQTYILWDDDDQAAATLVIDRWANPDLWTPAEATQPAAYTHKLTVARSHAGLALGRELLDWASTQAVHAALDWLRLDVWTTNRRLQQYYADHGFRHVRTVDLGHNPSGALFERPARITPTPRIDGGADLRALAEDRAAMPD